MSLRSSLFFGIAGTVLVSLVVTVVAGAFLTRRSLESAAIGALERQVELIAAQRSDPAGKDAEAVLGRFLATDEQRLAILSAPQAELLLPDGAASRIRAGTPASGSLEVRGERFLYAARRTGGDAIVLLRPAGGQTADWWPFVFGLAFAGLVGGLLAAGVALVLSRIVARPIARVALASGELAGGGRPAPLPVEGPREVARLSESFNELAEELRQTQESERAFLLSVSHELKTPLTAIRGHAEALADGVLEPAPAGAVIEREARRLERLVGDLLDLGRLRRRSFAVVSEPVDLGAVATAAVERHEPVARSLGIELTAVTDADAGALGDSERVLQALSNLVENALRTTPRGGCVRIVAGPGCIAVVDDGPGIDEGDLARAFERFYLYERAAGAPRVGSGLGLAIVKELAEAMGGGVAVRSEPGVGSTFVITLPVPARPRAASADTRARSSGPA